MSGPLEIVLIIAAIVYVLARRLAGEPAQPRRMVVLPVVLAAIGLIDLVKVAQTPVSIAFLIGTTLVSVLIGLFRGASVRLSQRNGQIIARYTGLTVLLWVVNVAIKFGGSFLLGAVDPAAAHASSTGLMLTLGAGMAAEGLLVMTRAARMSQANGGPGFSAMFDDLLASRGAHRR